MANESPLIIGFANGPLVSSSVQKSPIDRLVMRKEKIGIKYTVRAATAGLYTLLLVVGFQNCAIYQSEIGDSHNPSENPGDNGDNVPSTTSSTGNTGSTSTCQIISLSDGGTKTVTNHIFRWTVSGAGCQVEARLNGGTWYLCSLGGSCGISGNQYYRNIAQQYGTHTLDVRAYTSQGNILDQQQATVTIQRPSNCDSYNECVNKYNPSPINACSCEQQIPSLSPGHTCFTLQCDEEREL